MRLGVVAGPRRGGGGGARAEELVFSLSSIPFSLSLLDPRALLATRRSELLRGSLRSRTPAPLATRRARACKRVWIAAKERCRGGERERALSFSLSLCLARRVGTPLRPRTW
jgi:hypothetical protein